MRGTGRHTRVPQAELLQGKTTARAAVAGLMWEMVGDGPLFFVLSTLPRC